MGAGYAMSEGSLDLGHSLAIPVGSSAAEWSGLSG